jgi:hypothetical protein
VVEQVGRVDPDLGADLADLERLEERQVDVPHRGRRNWLRSLVPKPSMFVPVGCEKSDLS